MVLLPKLTTADASDEEKLRRLTVFGDAYLALSPEESASGPTDAQKEGLLADKGRWLRVGPFPWVAEDPQAGLDAAYEWLHAGARSAVVDVIGPGGTEVYTVQGGTKMMPPGLPNAEQVKAFKAALGECFGKELAARRGRVGA